MPSELNHDTIKTKIVAVLKLVSALFTTTAEANKIRKITVGYPQGRAEDDSMYPYIYITNSRNDAESVSNLGSIVSDSHTALEHTFHYDVTVVVNEADARVAEKALDDFQELVMETLEGDVVLAGSGSGDVDMSYPIRIAHLDAAKLGEGKKGRIITLRCIKVTGM